MRSKKWERGITILVAVLALIWLVPFIWMFLSSFKTLREAMAYPPSIIPSSWQWENYLSAWAGAPFLRYYFNSIFQGTVIIGLQIFTSVLAAYAFTFLKFPFKKTLFIIIISTIIVPPHITYIPNYLFFFRIGHLDSFVALIFPFAATGIGIFLIRQGFLSLPKALYEAALIDGANQFQILLYIMAPLVKPSIVTFALFNFVFHWNEFMWPLIATKAVEMRVLPVGVAMLLFEEQTRGIQWNLVMAANMSVVLPVLILFMFTQRSFVKSAASSAIKG